MTRFGLCYELRIALRLATLPKANREAYRSAVARARDDRDAAVWEATDRYEAVRAYLDAALFSPLAKVA